MLRELTELDWNETTEVVPAAVIALMMPFTYSIDNGLVLGFISRRLIELFTGKGRQVLGTVRVIGGMFPFKFTYMDGAEAPGARQHRLTVRRARGLIQFG
jgi:AGZA family xanthine/uracil permease-like MFS transporter